MFIRFDHKNYFCLKFEKLIIPYFLTKTSFIFEMLNIFLFFIKNEIYFYQHSENFETLEIKFECFVEKKKCLLKIMIKYV